MHISFKKGTQYMYASACSYFIHGDGKSYVHIRLRTSSISPSHLATTWCSIEFDVRIWSNRTYAWYATDENTGFGLLSSCRWTPCVAWRTIRNISWVMERYICSMAPLVSLVAGGARYGTWCVIVDVIVVSVCCVLAVLIVVALYRCEAHVDVSICLSLNVLAS